MKFLRSKRVPRWLLGTFAMVVLNALAWVVWLIQAPVWAILVQAVSLAGIVVCMLDALTWRVVRRVLKPSLADRLENFHRDGTWRASGLTTAMAAGLGRHDVTVARWAAAAGVPMPLASAVDRAFRAPGDGPVLLLACDDVVDKVRNNLDPLRAERFAGLDWSRADEAAEKAMTFRAVVLGPTQPHDVLECGTARLLFWSLAADAEVYSSAPLSGPLFEALPGCGVLLASREAGRCLQVSVIRQRGKEAARV